MAGFMNPNMAMGQFRLPTSTVELSISCTNLSDCDWLSKSDPVAFIFGKVKGQLILKDVFYSFTSKNERICTKINPEFENIARAKFVQIFCSFLEELASKKN